MQGDTLLVYRLDFVDTFRVVDVSTHTFFHGVNFDGFVTVLKRSISGLCELALKNSHDTPIVSVVMDWRSLVLIPAD